MRKHITLPTESRGITSQYLKDRELKSAKKTALVAVKDFKGYGVPGYDDMLIQNIKNATSEAEIRALLRKARATA